MAETLDQKKLKKLGQLRHHTNRLKKMISFPAFGRCFLIMGKMGSGKTHFLNSLLAERDENRSLFLPIAPSVYKQETLSDLILKRLNTTGSTWSSLESFDNALDEYNQKSKARQSPLRLVIVLDDLSKWSAQDKNFVRNLVQFIKDHSHLQNLYWLLTMPESYYAEMSIPDENFWMEYGAVKHLRNLVKQKETKLSRNEVGMASLHPLEGWLMLDDLNSQSEVGLNLIREAGGTLALDKEPKEGEKTREHLCNPFIAWMWLDIVEQKQKDAERVVTLNYIEFVENFWNRQKEALERTDARIQQGDLNKFVDYAARFLAQTGKFNYPKQELIKEAVNLGQQESQLLDQGKAELALNALQRSLLIRVWIEKDAMPGDSEQVELQFEVFWEFLLARELLKALEQTKQNENSIWERLIQLFFPSQALRPLLNQLNQRLAPFQAREIRDEILGFYILLEDRKSKRALSQHRLAAEICSLILKSPTLPKNAIWLSSTWASKEVQRSLLKHLASFQLHGTVNRRVLFAIMHFVSEVDDDLIVELSIPSRLGLLQPFYKQIADENLLPYFQYIVERLFSKLDRSEAIIREMKGLSNCEVMDHPRTKMESEALNARLAGNSSRKCPLEMEITPNLAELAVKALYKSVGQDIGQLVEKTLEYLRSISQEYTDHKKIPWQGKNHRWCRYLYREWVINEVCTYLTTEQGLNSYSILIRHHWYEDGKLSANRCLQRQLEQETSLAIGHLHDPRDNHPKYIEFITHLVKTNSLRDKNNAFWFIYHTIPHERDGDKKDQKSEVHHGFKPLLQELAHDETLMRKINYELGHIKGFLQENVDDWASLKEKLDKNNPRRYPRRYK